MATVSAGGLMVMLRAWVAVAFALSVTCAVKVDAPGVVGVPAIAPFDASDRPAGRLPVVTDHVYGPVPPVADSVCW